MANNNKSAFSFISQDSMIEYKEVKYNIEEIVNTKDPKNKDKLYFLYDKQSDKFIYFFDSNIFIFNSKGIVEKYIKVELKERVKLAAVEYKSNFLLLLTQSGKGIICDLLTNVSEDYSIFDKGVFVGGFFLKRKPDQDNNYCKLCMIETKRFIISKIYVEQTEKQDYIFKRKNFFISKEFDIFNYYYNSDFNVVIFRSDVWDFSLVNLKSKYCYETFIPLDHINANNIIEISLFLVRNIYNQLYFIHVNAKTIELYGLKDLKNKKPPKIIKLDYGVCYPNIKLQFTNNLVIVYNDYNIYIYDIKSKLNNKIMAINFQKNKDFNTFYKNMKIYGDFVGLGRNIYKFKFLSEKYYYKNIEDNEKEVFLVTLRRENTKNIIKSKLIEILQKYEIRKLYSFLYVLIKYNARDEKIIEYDKKNAYIIYSGKNYFYLNNDEIFAMFSRKIDNTDPIKIIQYMGIIYNLYKTNNIKVDNDIFISTLFYQLNQIKDLSFFESLFKNGLIPLNHKLGLYLIDRALHEENVCDELSKMDKNYKNALFTLGIENLLEKDNEEGMKEAIDDLLDKEQYFECFDLVSYYFCEKNFNDQTKLGYLYNFMSEQFSQFNKFGLGIKHYNDNENEDENINIDQEKEDNNNGNN